MAAESLDTEAVWDKFADVVVSNQHKMRVDRFQSCCNLAWAFSNVNYQGKHCQLVWQLIEGEFRKALDEVKTSEFRNVPRCSSVLSSMVMALKQNRGGLPDSFWVNLSSCLKQFAKELPQHPDYLSLKKDEEFMETMT